MRERPLLSSPRRGPRTSEGEGVACEREDEPTGVPGPRVARWDVLWMIEFSLEVAG